MVLYSVCVPGWLNTLVTSEQHDLRFSETSNVSVVSQKRLRVSRYKFVARYKVSKVVYLGDIEGHVTRENVLRDMPPSSARP